LHAASTAFLTSVELLQDRRPAQHTRRPPALPQYLCYTLSILARQMGMHTMVALHALLHLPEKVTAMVRLYTVADLDAKDKE
jgi:hypothetical protein